MEPKRPYTPPAIFKVELNAEQAVLSACSLTTTNAASGMPDFCRAGNCKSHHNAQGSDSGARPS